MGQSFTVEISKDVTEAENAPSPAELRDWIELALKNVGLPASVSIGAR